MLTNYELELIKYWKDWKPGMGNYKGEQEDEAVIKVEVRHTPPVEKVDMDYLVEDIGDKLWDII